MRNWEVREPKARYGSRCVAFFFSFDLGRSPGEADSPAAALSERVNVTVGLTARTVLASGRLMNDDVSAEEKAAAIRHRRSGQRLAGRKRLPTPSESRATRRKLANYRACCHKPSTSRRCG